MADEVRIPLEIVNHFSGELRNLSAQYARLSSQQNELHRRGVAGARDLSASQRELQRTVSATERHFTALGERGGRALQGLLSSTIRWTTYASSATVAVAGLLVRQGILLNSEFERYALTLETVQRSQAKANTTLAWIVNFAKTTPFEVQGLAESATQLEALGLSARKWLPLIGDLSAAFGGSKEKIDELVRAVGLLRSGVAGEAFESLRRSGITRREFEARGIAFDKAGQLKSDPEAAMAALEEIIQTRFGGLMARLSATFAGAMSNIQDFATNALRETTAPLFKTATAEANSFLNVLNQMEESGALRLLTNRAGSLLNQGATSILALGRQSILDPLAAGAGLGEIARGIFEVAKGPAAEFATWFAGRLADGIIAALKTLATSSDGLKLLGLYAGFRFLPQMAGGAAGLAGRGVGAVSGRFFGGGVGDAAAAAGAAAFGSGFAGRASGLTAMPYHDFLRAQYRMRHPVPALPANFASDGTPFTYTFIDNPVRRTIGQRLMGGASAVDRFGTRLGFGAVPTLGVSGVLGAAAIPTGLFAAYHIGRAQFDLDSAGEMNNLTFNRSAREARRRQIAAVSGRRVNFNALMRARMLELSAEAAGIGTDRSFYETMFGVDENKRVDERNRRADIQRQMLAVPGAVGTEAFDANKQQIEDLTTRFLSLADSIDRFGDSARDNITTQVGKFTTSIEAMLGKAFSVDQQIERSADRLRNFARDRRRLDFEYASTTLSTQLDPTQRGDRLSSLSDEFLALNARETTERINRRMLEFKAESNLIKQNQGVLEQFVASTQGTGLERFNFLKDAAEASDVRARLLAGGGAGVSFQRFVQLSRLGLVNDSEVRDAAIPEFRKALTSQFGADRAQSILENFERTGGFSSDAAAERLAESMNKFVDQFKAQGLFDIDDINRVLKPIRDGIEAAMESGARLAATTILRDLTAGMTGETARKFAAAFMREFDALMESRRNRVGGGGFSPDVFPAGL